MKGVQLGVVGLVLATLLVFSAQAETFTVTNLEDDGDGSLRAAIDDASDGDVIEFDVTGTITLTSGHLDIDVNLTIVGPGADRLTISGNGSSRVFDINADAIISGLTVADGDEDEGGGISCENGEVELIDCAVKDNIAELGGGIFLLDCLMVMQNCTVSGNRAEEGGGIFVLEPFLVMVNCTVSDNEATNGNGGGIFSANSGVGLAFCTVTNNHASENGGGACSGGTSSRGMPTVTTNTIMANNTCGDDGPDFAGEMTSLGYNLFGDVDFDNYSQPENPGTDTFGENPLLGPLQDNGGPTGTHALQSGSPAIDGGLCVDLDVPFGVIAEDQRGVTRPQGETCDIGAYEYQHRRPASGASPPASGCGVNHPPVPDAGEDQVACVGERVFLDGSRSYDPDEGIPPNRIMGNIDPKYVHQPREGLDFQWAIAVLYYAAGRPVLAVPDTADVQATMQDSNTEIASFIPYVAGVYEFDLTVTDDFGETLSDRVTISVVECSEIETPSEPVDDFRFEQLVVNPNPTDGEVRFGFVGDGVADMAVTVFDLGGHVVWEGHAVDATEVVWNGRGSDGRQLASGAYIYRVVLVAEDLRQTRTDTIVLMP